MIYFLSYFHPNAGLCNQLYLITNHIHDAYKKGVQLFIDKFNVDIFNKKRVCANEVINIDATNDNIKKLTGKEILVSQQPTIVEYIPKLCIYPVSSIEILNCLEFNKGVIEKVEIVQSKMGSIYNSVHFRLDIDAVVHYVFGKEIYTTFMNTELKNEYFQQLDQNKINDYCNFLLNQYFTLIEQFGFESPWYICTSITKWKVHDPMVPFLTKFTDFISKNGGKYLIQQPFYCDRELNALVDLLVLRDSTKMIGFEGSSFSEGYCYKVNLIRKKTMEYLFVKEYP